MIKGNIVTTYTGFIVCQELFQIFPSPILLGWMGLLCTQWGCEVKQLAKNIFEMLIRLATSNFSK